MKHKRRKELSDVDVCYKLLLLFVVKLRAVVKVKATDRLESSQFGSQLEPVLTTTDTLVSRRDGFWEAQHQL